LKKVRDMNKNDKKLESKSLFVKQIAIPDNIQIIELKNVNCYLVNTEVGFILIDTGFNKDRALVEKYLEDNGIKPESKKLKLILLTHGDFDHTGNAAYLRAKYDAKIAMHKDDVGMVEYGDFSWNRNINIILSSIVKVIAFTLGMRLKKKDKFTPDLLLEDKQDLTELGFLAKVISLPGHSKGSIGFITLDGDFFCGDILQNVKQPEPASMVSDKEALEKSLRKIKGLEIGTIYPGHGKPFELNALNFKIR